MSTFTPPSIEELQEKFPQYSIEGFIAQGGMGAVYLARQISLDRPVAIKILPQEFGDDADYRASFETEAKAMAKLNHTNLVGIYDFGEIYGMLYIVMEYIPGRTLFDTANGQQVDEKEAARLISDMSEGLAHAHDAGMLHRDIKPANVLIDDEAKPKIVDFGLARPMGEEQTEGVVFGTPGYTAPEVLSNPFAVDHRSDIFSMGVMLYELLTGHLPGTPVVPVSRASNSDPRFDPIIAKSIHPNPAMRYGSADKLSKDLDALIDNFEEPKKGLAASPGLVAAGGSAVRPGGAVAGLAGAHSKVLPSAKKSNAGVMIFTLLLLVVGGVVAMKVVNSEPKGPSKAEIAKAEAAKKLEEERKAKLEAERKAYAEKQRQKKIADRKARQREEERQAKLDAEEEKREEEEAMRKEEEKEKREAQAKMEAEKLAQEEKERLEKEKEAMVPEFDLDGFLKSEKEAMKLKLDGLRDKADDLLEPVFDKLERELKREARRYAKGKKGQRYQDLIEKYMEATRENGAILDLPKGIHVDLLGEVEEIIAEYREKEADALKWLDDDKNDIRKEYIKRLKKKQAELLAAGDKVGAESLDDAIDSVDRLEDFMLLFEEKEEDDKDKKKKK